MSGPRTFDSLQYHARYYRTKALQHKIVEDVEVMIYSLLNLHDGKGLTITKLDPPVECPGFPFAPKHHWRVSYNQWGTTGETRNEALCKFLGIIIDGCWEPKT